MQEYRIDDLAREAGTTVRNVRVYQDRGLLPPPRKQGRTGWYAESHLARLRLITRLLERGYTFSVIGELLETWQRGQRLEDLLGLEDVVTQPWNTERPTRLTMTDLRRLLGTQATSAALKRACQIGLLERHGVSYTAPSPRLLEAAGELVAAGVPFPLVLDLAEALHRDLSVVATRFVDLAVSQLLPDTRAPLTPGETAELTRVVTALRPQAGQAVQAVFAQAMDAEVTAALGRLLSQATHRPS